MQDNLIFIAQQTSQLPLNTLPVMPISIRHRFTLMDETRTCRISLSAVSRSSSRVKQWQCTIGITGYNASRSMSDPGDGANMPRNASRNMIAESGRFMTKCEMRLRGDGCGGRDKARDCCVAC